MFSSAIFSRHILLRDLACTRANILDSRKRILRNRKRLPSCRFIERAQNTVLVSATWPKTRVPMKRLRHPEISKSSPFKSDKLPKTALTV